MIIQIQLQPELQLLQEDTKWQVPQAGNLTHTGCAYLVLTVRKSILESFCVRKMATTAHKCAIARYAKIKIIL